MAPRHNARHQPLAVPTPRHGWVLLRARRVQQSDGSTVTLLCPQTTRATVHDLPGEQMVWLEGRGAG